MATQQNQAAVKNQKVFVALDDVLTLQAEINRLWQSGDRTRDFVRGLIRAAEILGLPIKADFRALIAKPITEQERKLINQE